MNEVSLYGVWFKVDGMWFKVYVLDSQVWVVCRLPLFGRCERATVIWYRM